MVTAKRPRGRPPFKVTPALQRRVSIAAGGGMGREEIAMAIGCSKDTLEKHFAYELSIGAHERRVEVLEALHRQAKKGGVAAVKAYLAVQAQFNPPPAASVAEPKPVVAKVEPLGKKEQADVAAKTAQRGTEWEELLPEKDAPATAVTH